MLLWVGQLSRRSFWQAVGASPAGTGWDKLWCARRRHPKVKAYRSCRLHQIQSHSSVHAQSMVICFGSPKGGGIQLQGRCHRNSVVLQRTCTINGYLIWGPQGQWHSIICFSLGAPGVIAFNYKVDGCDEKGARPPMLQVVQVGVCLSPLAAPYSPPCRFLFVFAPSPVSSVSHGWKHAMPLFMAGSMQYPCSCSSHSFAAPSGGHAWPRD